MFSHFYTEHNALLKNKARMTVCYTTDGVFYHRIWNQLIGDGVYINMLNTHLNWNENNRTLPSQLLIYYFS